MSTPHRRNSNLGCGNVARGPDIRFGVYGKAKSIAVAVEACLVLQAPINIESAQEQREGTRVRVGCSSLAHYQQLAARDPYQLEHTVVSGKAFHARQRSASSQSSLLQRATYSFRKGQSTESSMHPYRVRIPSWQHKVAAVQPIEQYIFNQHAEHWTHSLKAHRRP